MRSIRGAITVENNTKTDILDKTRLLLQTIIKENEITIEDIISIVFTATNDLTKVYPAVAAREIGIVSAGLMCMAELNIENSMRKCIRVLMNIDSAKKQSEMKHIYLGEAVKLRPDLAKKTLAVAIDGPSGVGKSTVARLLANDLKYIYVDTGAMYRAVALYGILNGYNISNQAEVESYLENVFIKLAYFEGVQRIYLNDKDVTEDIRTTNVSEGASKVAECSAVRKKLVSMQRDIALNNNVIMDGRDIGTVVLKDALVKIYLDAKTEIRARRRTKELLEKGIEADFYSIEQDISQRDERDRNRNDSPLKMADDAIYLDTSNMQIEQVKKFILDCIKAKN